MFNFYIEAGTSYSNYSAVILSGGYASNGAATHGSQSDGDASNTTVSASFSCGSVGHMLVTWLFNQLILIEK